MKYGNTSVKFNWKKLNKVVYMSRLAAYFIFLKFFFLDVIESCDLQSRVGTLFSVKYLHHFRYENVNTIQQKEEKYLFWTIGLRGIFKIWRRRNGNWSFPPMKSVKRKGPCESPSHSIIRIRWWPMAKMKKLQNA